MESGILSPAFLQAACAHKPEEQPVVINLKALQVDPTITELSSTGEITITTTKNGEARTGYAPALTGHDLMIEADDQAAITLSALGLVINVLGDQVLIIEQEPADEWINQPEM